MTDRPEIVIALTSALGTDLGEVEAALVAALRGVGYETKTLRVSDLIAQVVDEQDIEYDPGESPDETAMNKGDALRSVSGYGGIAASLALAANVRDRVRALGGTGRDERPAHATLIRQLKHPDEVQQLRDVYGGRFVLIACWSSLDERLSALQRRLVDKVPGNPGAWYAGYAHKLINRDQKDEQITVGQQVRRTFQLADAFLALRAGSSCEPDVRRLIFALFGHPFATPTLDEQGMFYAYGAKFRSSAAGRQVGAVAVDPLGEVLATGTNDVPRAGGGQYWAGDDPDHRDFVAGFDFNERETSSLVIDLMERLRTHVGWLSEEKAALDASTLARLALEETGPVRQSRIKDLLEFGRIMHAEMAVIANAARRGTPLGGSTLFTTTYPCHECARLIVGTGIARVVYVDPYPKSMVTAMFADQTTDTPTGSPRVRFEAFAGIAPRVFATVFEMRGRDKDDVTGRYTVWQPASTTLKLMETRDHDLLYLDREDAVVSELGGWAARR